MNYKESITYRKVLQYYYEKSKIAWWRTPVLISIRIIILWAMIIEPWFITQLISIASDTNPDINKVRLYAWYIWLTSVIEFLWWRMIEHLIVPAQVNTMRAIALEAFGYIQRHWSTFFANTMSWSLLKRVKEGMSEFENIYDIFIFDLITPVWLIIWSVTILLIENIYLGSMLALRVVIFITVQLVMYKTKGEKESEAVSLKSLWSWYIADTFSNHDTVEHMGNITSEENTHKKKITDWAIKERAHWYYWNRIYAIAWWLSNLLRLWGIIMVVILWQAWTVEISVLVLFLLYVDKLLNQLRWIWNVFKRLVKSLENGREYLALMMTPHEIQNEPNAIDANWKSPSLSLRSITFGYNKDIDKKLFKDFSLSIKPFEKIGLVWESGSGKSTLVRLFLRLYDVDAWSVRIGDTSIDTYTVDSVRSSISYVPQEPILFHRSIWENIKYWKPDATQEELIEATKRARAYEFIMQLPNWFDSLVGERGVKLSGWQRQRVAIARAILQDTDIIILDEATSALDSQTEQDIQEAMEEVMKWKTAIVIAHRLSTVKKLDRLIVMEEWRIIEEWTHNQLVSQWKKYAKMVSLQSNF